MKTLKAIGLSEYFTKESIIGRWCAEPKPSPNGIKKLLNQWNVFANDALIVGDYLYDLQVGRAAGVATVHVDPSENCFPMIPSGKPHNQMILGPNDKDGNKITGKGKALV